MTALGCALVCALVILIVNHGPEFPSMRNRYQHRGDGILPGGRDET